METRKCDHQIICKSTRRARSSVMTLLAAARDLPQYVIPATKLRSRRPLKTSKHTDENWNPQLVHQNSKGCNRIFSGTYRCIQHRLQRNLNIPIQRATSKPLLTPLMKNKCLQFARRYLPWGVDDRKKVMWLLLLSTHSSLIIGGSPLLLSYGGSPPASPASHIAGLLRRRDPSTNPGPTAWCVSVGN